MDREELFREIVWQIQEITGMSKKEVLEQVYPDELEIIFERKRQQEIQRYEDYRHTMIAIAAGFGGKTEDGKTLFEIYNKQIDDVINQLENGNQDYEEKEYTVETVDQELDKLRGLNNLINQTKQKKRR